MQTEKAIYHDSRYFRVGVLQNLIQTEGRVLAGKWKDEFTIYLYHFPEYPVAQKITVGSTVSMKNNSRFAILNVSIYLKDTKKEVLSIKRVSPSQIIQFEFSREGSYDLLYSIADNQKIEKRNIKIVPQLRKPSNLPHNFDPQLKPTWY